MYLDLWKFIHGHLTDNDSVILMVVVDVKGSSPGRAGFKMAVAEKGEITGSIGGGVMEYNMVELARKKLKENISQPFIKRQVHVPDAREDSSGLLCAGEQTQAFIPLTAKNLATIWEIINCVEKGDSGVLKISPEEFRFIKYPVEPVSAFNSENENWDYTEEVGLKETIYIFGAGHVSVPLSQVLRMLDFRVVVFDDRDNLSTFNSNHFAHRKQVIDYADVSGLVPEGPWSYAAIMSFAHKSDRLILGQLLHKKLKYLGMIGSKNKVRTTFDSLREDGFTEEDFARVDSPIGIPISSQTPAEIAVSIAASIIQIKNEK